MQINNSLKGIVMLLRIISITIIISLLQTLFSCATTQVRPGDPVYLSDDMIISKVILENGATIYFNELGARYDNYDKTVYGFDTDNQILKINIAEIKLFYVDDKALVYNDEEFYYTAFHFIDLAIALTNLIIVLSK